MFGGRGIFAIILAMAFLFSGCVVRTYSVQKERADLDLNSGNRGYLAGQTTAPATVAKTTRETKVVEIEIFPLIKSLQKDKSVSSKSEQAQLTEPEVEEIGRQQAAAGITVLPQEYKVQDNDTLQKISQKFYGTMHKWNKIYEANKDRLKGPDKIKPGQVIKIPGDIKSTDAPAPKAVRAKEPIENLK